MQLNLILCYFTEHVDNRMLIKGNVTTVRLQVQEMLSSYGR